MSIMIYCCNVSTTRSESGTRPRNGSSLIPDEQIILCHIRRRNLSFCPSDMICATGLGFRSAVVHFVQWKNEQGIASICCQHSSWMSTLSKTFWKVIESCVQKDISNVKTRGDLIACVLKCWRELHSTCIWQLYEPFPRQSRCIEISKNVLQNESRAGMTVDSSWVKILQRGLHLDPWIESTGIPSSITHQPLPT